MINPFRKRVKKVEYTGSLFLRLDRFSNLARDYGDHSEVFPAKVVVLYNTKELAAEIAKALKDSTGDNSQRDNNCENTPK
jgi:hypothetical protein